MSKEHFTNADRLCGFQNQRVQDIFTPLAIETNSINLGQAFPNWQPPEVFQSAISKHVDIPNNSNQPTNFNATNPLIKSVPSHQYTRAYGLARLATVISDVYSPLFNQKIDPLKNVLISNGGIACLCNIFLGIINPGDEVILIEPSFDVYRAQISMAGGKVISVPLFPKSSTKVSKQMLLDRGLTDVKHVEEQDAWDLDWDLLKNSFNERTKAILINTPHNPTGKIFSQEELERIAAILEEFPRVVVVFDAVYEAHAYDQYEPMFIPRIATLPNMWDRTVSISSAGKLFSATGLRVGWAIGPEHLIKCAAAFHQYNGFCLYGPIQEAIADTLEYSLKSTYFSEFNSKLRAGRSTLVKELVGSPLNFSIYVPEGGCSVLAEISAIELPQKYYYHQQDENSGTRLTKDWAFCMWLCKERGIVALPCSAFYSKENAHIGANFVRIAFCKTQELLLEAGKRFRSNSINKHQKQIAQPVARPIQLEQVQQSNQILQEISTNLLEGEKDSRSTINNTTIQIL